MLAHLRETDERLASTQDELVRRDTQLQEREAKHADMLMLQDDAVKFTLQCLEDVRTRHVAGDAAASEAPAQVESGDHSERSLRSLDTEQREAVLGYLLEQLRAYQGQLQELELHAAWKQHNTNMPRAAAMHGDGNSNYTTHRLPPISPSGGQGMWSVAPPPHIPYGGGGQRGRCAVPFEADQCYTLRCSP